MNLPGQPRLLQASATSPPALNRPAMLTGKLKPKLKQHNLFEKGFDRFYPLAFHCKILSIKRKWLEKAY
jgi:hypothetical protein